MATFELEKDGAKFQIEAPDEAAALSAFQAMHGETAPTPKTGNIVGEIANQALEGVPVLGPLAKKATAAIDATTMAIPGVQEADKALGLDNSSMSKAGSWGQRYSENLEFQKKRTEKFAEEHPIVAPVARVGGAIAALGPAMAAAPAAFGLTGTLPQMVARGALSGGALGGADAVARGTDPVHEAEVGALLGAPAGPIGKVIGKAVGAFRAKPAPIPERVETVAGVEIPLPNRDPAAASTIEIARKGGAGEKAARVVQEADQAAEAKIAQATENIGASLDPTVPPGGARQPIATPAIAADTVTAELTAAEQARSAQAAATEAQAAAGTERLRGDIGGQPVPAVLAPSPFAAAETIGAGVQRAAAEARAARKAAYDAKALVPGEYAPTPVRNAPEAVAKAISNGKDRVTLSETGTPLANDAMRVLSERTTQAADDARIAVRDPATGRMTKAEKPQPITGQTVEEIRKDLNVIYADARKKAAAPGGSDRDLRAVSKIIDAFDGHLAKVEKSGAFSGDAAALEQAREAARAAHASYRRTFSAQGSGDETGKIVEKIVGRYDQAAQPVEIAGMAYGPAATPGGAKAIRVAQRLNQIFPEGSAERAAYKQGLFSHLVDAADGSGPRPFGEAAARIERYLSGPEGRGHAQVALTQADRAALAAHAQTLRASVPAKLADLDSVGKLIARISGRDGGTPVTTSDVVEYLFNMTGKALPVRLAQKLQSELTPAGWTALRQGMFSRVTDAATEPALVKQLDAFLHGRGSPMANALYPKGSAERAAMEKLLEVHRQRLPVPGTTNPSGTAPMAAKITERSSHAVLPLIFGTHGAVFGGGIPGALAGAAIGTGVDRAARATMAARRASEATRLIYGKQPELPISPTFGTIGGGLSQTPLAFNR